MKITKISGAVSHEFRISFRKRLDIFIGFLGVISLTALILMLGFYLTKNELQILNYTIFIISTLFVIQEYARILITVDKKDYIRSRWAEILLAVLVLLYLILHFFSAIVLQELGLHLGGVERLIFRSELTTIAILVNVGIKTLRYNDLVARIKLHPGMIFALSFAFIILTGALMLMLPKATTGNHHIKFIDALFTSTSAVCVTGLTVVDTAKYFTTFGQLIVLGLIQIGGLGVMTLTTFFAFALSGAMSFKIRILMKDLLSQESMSEIGSLLKRIIMLTLSIEFIGAVICFYSLGGNFIFPKWHHVYPAIFHSVSAFCNAGFSIYSMNLADPLVQHNYLFLSTIMGLIVFGGLGFTVLSNLIRLKPFDRTKRLKYQLRIESKVVIITTLSLIVFGTILLFWAEPFLFVKDWSSGEKLFHSLFLAITPRTAGYNTIPTEALGGATVMILITLMWIGASPGSTGGGIKTSTFAVAVLSLWALIHGKTRVEVFHREIDHSLVVKSFMVMLSAMLALGIGATILCWIEPNKTPIDLIFEATSALGTVGLSRNISPYLGTGGKAIIVALMYVGRIGVLTFLTSFIRPPSEPRYSLPKESLMIG